MAAIASFENAACSPAKNFLLASWSCQRRYFAELPNCSPVLVSFSTLRWQMAAMLA